MFGECCDESSDLFMRNSTLVALPVCYLNHCVNVKYLDLCFVNEDSRKRRLPSGEG